MSGDALLELRGLTRRFGSLVAVSDLSFSVARNSITSLIGPNGAGKSTIFNLVTGFLAPTSGEILYDGASIVGLQPHQVNQRGIARAFQISHPFANMTVRENVRVGAMFGRGGQRDVDCVVDAALTACRLVDLADNLASELTVGGLRRMELGRAMATRPALLLADEPLAGLLPAESREILDTLRGMRDAGVTVFLVEHDMQSVMSISDRVIVVEAGRKIAEDVPANVVKNPQVIEAYLGSDAIEM